MAIAFVMNGQEVWIGNDEIEPADSPARFLGALASIKEAITNADLAHTVPAGSVGLLVTYGDVARLRVPTGPIEGFDAKELGTQKDYYGKVGTEMVQGIQLAMMELDKTTAATKVMIVLGDGNDTNNEAAKPQLQLLKATLAAKRITPYAVMFKGSLSDPASVITTLVPTARTVSGAANLSVELAAVLHECCHR